MFWRNVPSVSGQTTVVVTGTTVVCGDDPGAPVEPVLEPVPSVPVVPRQAKVCAYEYNECGGPLGKG